MCRRGVKNCKRVRCRIRTTVAKQVRRCRRGLQNGATRGKVSAKHGDDALFGKWIVESTNYLFIPILCANEHDSIDPIASDAFFNVHASRLRKSIAVGRKFVSPVDITGNSRGNPPASHTSFLTRSARARRCALQGVSSDQVLQMPITGRPSKTSPGIPDFSSSSDG
jgi:hypothetical protein